MKKFDRMDKCQYAVGRFEEVQLLVLLRSQPKLQLCRENLI